MPWPVGQKVLRELDFARGQGWDQTVLKITNAHVSEEKLADLNEALREHLLFGEKSTRFYELDDAEIAACQTAAMSAAIESTAFSEAYPSLVDENQLAGLSSVPLLTAIEEDEEGTAFVFCSVRTIVVREPLGPEDFPGQSADAIFESFDEIIGLKNRRLQAVDVVWVPNAAGRADVRVDFPAGMAHEAVEAAHLILRNAFNTLVGAAILGDPVNVFRLIDRMYFDPNEGSVVEIGFGTTTASVKHEKMRRKGLNLRTESYHVGGKAALRTPIEPFRVSLVWRRHIGRDRFSFPELGLNSNSRVAGSAAPAMFSVIIRKCMGASDYEFVRSRIEHHLNTPAA
ncbi:hypothetical protein MesoLj131c_63690 [Mesorhizobium sp. 131-3-5]|nr:hypothetical protein MesoLj131c_63690 [Mesorhizobium sp. 131-3-5]